MTPSSPSPRGRPRDVDRAARRDALLETAMRLFLSHGYGGTTIELVATRARVAKRTIYTTIGDKADLFVAVVRRLGDRVVNPTRTGPEPDVYGFGVRLVRLMLSDEAVGLHRLVIAEATTFPDLATRLYANGPRRYIDVLRTMLAELAGPAGDTRVDLDALAESLFTVLLGEPHRRRLFGLAEAPDEETVHRLVAGALDVVLPSEISAPAWRPSGPA